MSEPAVAVWCALAGASLTLTLLSYATVTVSRRAAPSDGPLPPISVLRPVSGLDDGLHENLVALVRQDYPVFEIVVGASDPRDPALDVARRVAREFPHVPMTIVAGAPPFGLNPKVRNLAAMTERARYDLVLVSDSNVRPGGEYLRAMAREIARDGVGLVSSALVGKGGSTLGACLDGLQLNTFVAGSISAIDTVTTRPAVVGKSMLLRRTHLERIGGWRIVADVLAEDFVLGERFAQAGFRVAWSRYLVDTLPSAMRLRDFWARHLRWSQMRRRMAGVAYCFEPLLNPTPLWLSGLLLAAGGATIAGSTGLLVASVVAAVAAKSVADLCMDARLRAEPPRWSLLPWAPVKDVAILAVWAAGAFRRTVSWRGNHFRLGKGTVLEAVANDDADLPRVAADRMRHLLKRVMRA